MKKILIADASKASLVMTSEVFKDHYPGIQVLVARTATDALSLAKSAENIDAFIIDFDLPDMNGAQTALKLKKLSEIPILITAFDREDVNQSIESLLINYDDCRSWLKKPVTPEIVIAVAQRYCDGKIRVQRRVNCHLPAMAIMDIQKASTKSIEELKPKKGAKKAEAEITTPLKKVKPKKSIQADNEPLIISGIIEDCSLSGVKFKPIKSLDEKLSAWSKVLENIQHIEAGSFVTVKVPSSLEIENSKSSTFSGKGNTFKFDEGKYQSLLGKVIWTSSESGEWSLGIEFENQALSKRLFEAVISLYSKSQKSFQFQSMMKSSRTA